MISADDWTAFEADVLSIDTRPPIVGECNYHDWTRCEFAITYRQDRWGDQIVIIKSGMNDG